VDNACTSPLGSVVCAQDPTDLLTTPAYWQAVHDNTFPQTLSLTDIDTAGVGTAERARSVLATLRSSIKDGSLRALMDQIHQQEGAQLKPGQFFLPPREELRRAVVRVRRIAGESGPDPVLSGFFGDVTTYPTEPWAWTFQEVGNGPHHDGWIAPASMQLPNTNPRPENPSQETNPTVMVADGYAWSDVPNVGATRLQPVDLGALFGGKPEVRIQTTGGASVDGSLDTHGVRKGLVTTPAGQVYRPLGWGSGLYLPIRKGSP
jgi:hypothetical protein